MEEDFRYFSADDIKQKIEEIKAISNGDLKSAINSLYIFSLSLDQKEKMRKKNLENFSKRNKASKISRTNSKNFNEAV